MHADRTSYVFRAVDTGCINRHFGLPRYHRGILTQPQVRDFQVAIRTRPLFHAGGVGMAGEGVPELVNRAVLCGEGCHRPKSWCGEIDRGVQICLMQH